MLHSKCPYCQTEGCYNSGFSVECINTKCKFYSKKQHDWYLTEKKKLETSKPKIEPPKVSEKEFYDPDVESSYGPYPSAYPGPYGTGMPIYIPVPGSSKQASNKTANMGNTQTPMSLKDRLEARYKEEVYKLMNQYNLSYDQAKEMLDRNVDVW